MPTLVNHLDLSKYELRNARLQNLATDPTSPVEGQLYHNSASHEPLIFNGTSWVSLLATGGAPDWTDITGKPTTLSGYGITDAAPLASPTFTGTPAAPTASAGTNTAQLATTAFVSTAISNLVGTAPELLNTLGEISDAINDNENIATTLNDAIALKANTASPTFTGTVTLPGDPAVALGAATKQYVDNAVGTHRYSTNIGDAVETSFVITHNLNTRDVVVGVRANASPYNVVLADVEATSVNTVTVRTASPPAANEYRVTVLS